MLLGEEPYGENPRKARKPGPKLIELINQLSSLSSLSSPDSIQQSCHQRVSQKNRIAARNELKICEKGRPERIASHRELNIFIGQNRFMVVISLPGLPTHRLTTKELTSNRIVALKEFIEFIDLIEYKEFIEIIDYNKRRVFVKIK